MEDTKKIKNLSHKKKLNALNDLSVPELKQFSETFKVSLPAKAKKDEIIRLLMRKT